MSENHDERGVPRVADAEAAPGLRFIGYRPRPAHIGYMGAEARRAALDIAGRSYPGRRQKALVRPRRVRTA